MATRDTGTEQLIIDTAKKIFFSEGKFNATMQDIADAAGITRTLVNYYFRSKEILLETVIKVGMKDSGARFDAVLASDLPFKEKIGKFIEVFMAHLIEYPYQDSFMISEINSNGSTLLPKERPPVFVHFLNEVKTEMKNGTLKKMKPENFIINLFSLMAYPLLVKPLFKNMLDVNDAQYAKLLKERKKAITDILFI